MKKENKKKESCYLTDKTEVTQLVRALPDSTQFIAFYESPISYENQSFEEFDATKKAMAFHIDTGANYLEEFESNQAPATPSRETVGNLLDYRDNLATRFIDNTCSNLAVIEAITVEDINICLVTLVNSIISDYVESGLMTTENVSDEAKEYLTKYFTQDVVVNLCRYNEGASSFLGNDKMYNGVRPLVVDLIYSVTGYKAEATGVGERNKYDSIHYITLVENFCAKLDKDLSSQWSSAVVGSISSILTDDINRLNFINPQALSNLNRDITAQGKIIIDKYIRETMFPMMCDYVVNKLRDNVTKYHNISFITTLDDYQTVRKAAERIIEEDNEDSGESTVKIINF